MTRLFAALLAFAAVAGAAPVAVPPVRVVVRDGVDPGVEGARLVVIPGAARFLRPAALLPLSGRTLAIRTPLARASLPALRAWAGKGGCRLAVHAEATLTLDDVTMLEQIGPCTFEVHVGTPPWLLVQRLARLRPLALVWEAGSEVPNHSELGRFSAFAQPVLSLSADRGLTALAALDPFADRVALALRARDGVLDAPTLEALRAPSRLPQVVIVADRGLALEAARDLRLLERARVDVSLEQLAKVPPSVVESLRALVRPVDPVNERRVPDEFLEAPLLRPR